MRSKKISIKTISIILLIGIIITLVVINLNNKNTSITKQETSKEQLEETTDNAYVSMETHLSELNAKQQEIDNMQASSISYDNTSSGLDSNNVQSAVDELDTQLETEISSLSNNLKDYAIVRTVYKEYTCNANSNIAINIEWPEVSGYKPIISTMVSTGNPYAYAYVCDIGSTVVRMDIMNTHSSEISGTVSIRILYIRDI